MWSFFCLLLCSRGSGDSFQGSKVGSNVTLIDLIVAIAKKKLHRRMMMDDQVEGDELVP